jgi:hypothetical protein
MADQLIHVCYLELTQAPPPVVPRARTECIAVEKMSTSEYLDLYTRVGAPLRWDQRLQMSRECLELLLQSGQSRVYVLRDSYNEALGFCEFEVPNFPHIRVGRVQALQHPRRAIGRPLSVISEPYWCLTRSLGNSLASGCAHHEHQQS